MSGRGLSYPVRVFVFVTDPREGGERQIGLPPIVVLAPSVADVRDRVARVLAAARLAEPEPEPEPEPAPLTPASPLEPEREPERTEPDLPALPLPPLPLTPAEAAAVELADVVDPFAPWEPESGA